jgi:hypothetical protein
VQQRHPGIGQRDPRGLQQLTGFALGKAQLRSAELGQLAGEAEPMQLQPQITTRCQDRVHVSGKVRQQARELGEGLRRVQLVEIIDNQRDAVASIGELR